MFETLPMREMYLENFRNAGLKEEEYEPCEVTHIPNWDDATPFIGAAMFLAILAYPKLEQREKRDDLVFALRSFYSKELIKRNLQDRSKVASGFRSFPNQQMDGRLSRAGKRISKRLAMTRINGHVKLATRFKNNSSVTKYFRNMSKGNESVQRSLMRDWSETKPVLHLANAFWSILSEICPPEKLGVIEWTMEEFIIFADKWVEKTVYLAENNRLFFSDGTTIKPTEQVSLIYPGMP
jgi:hypothetical protein